MRTSESQTGYIPKDGAAFISISGFTSASVSKNSQTLTLALLGAGRGKSWTGTWLPVGEVMVIFGIVVFILTSKFD